MSKMRNLVLSMLLIAAMMTSIFASAIVLIRPIYAVSASDFYGPTNTTGPTNLNPAPGTISSPYKANVSNIPSPGLWGYELYTALSKTTFPDQIPLTNMNFTGSITGWTIGTTIGFGTPTSGYDGSMGNPSPGSGAGSLRLRANATGSHTADILFDINSPSFTWNLGGPPDQGVVMSFAYTLTGNSIGNTLVNPGALVTPELIRPDASVKTLLAAGTVNYYGAKAWTYNRTVIVPASFFNKADGTPLTGSYHLDMVTEIETAGTATTNYVQWNWDDIGIVLAPVRVDEGSFLKAKPPVVPVTNMNFTGNDNGWGNTATIVSGTEIHGYDSSTGNPSPGSGAGSERLRANSTAGAIAKILWVTNTTFTWTSGTPLNAYLSFAYRITGNSIPANGTILEIRLMEPDSSFIDLIPPTKFSTTKAWTYNRTIAGTAAFSQSGTYQLQLVTNCTTAATGATNYNQVNWDDVGLKLYVAGGGNTFFTAQYKRYATNNTLYVADSITGNPYVDGVPVQGAGNLYTVKILVGYGWSYLHLYKTQLITLGPAPGYPPLQLAHTDTDAWFDNRIPGDVNSDGTVNIADIGGISAHWTGAPGALPYDRAFDPNLDGVDNIADIGIVSAHWNQHFP